MIVLNRGKGQSTMKRSKLWPSLQQVHAKADEGLLDDRVAVTPPLDLYGLEATVDAPAASDHKSTPDDGAASSGSATRPLASR